MNKLIDYIEKYDTLSIFRHHFPDGDALGSQWGVAQYIKDNYPEKTVYVVGKDSEVLGFHPASQYVTDSQIASSHAIVLDSATEARIDGNHTLAKTVLNIDHHPNNEPYGDDFVVDPSRSSASEIVAELLLEKGMVSKQAASYMLSGILTDTIRFMVENTKPETLEIAAKLMRCGANITQLSMHFFNRSQESFGLRSKLAQYVEYDAGLATITITKAMRDAMNINERQAKTYYSIMSNVTEFEVYGVFVETDEGNFIGSLRSQNVTVNEIANRFNGGGHRLASGINDITFEQVQSLKEALKTAIKNYKEQINV